MSIWRYVGPQAVPIRPSGKGRLSVDKIHASGEGMMKGGGRSEIELGLKTKLI
jgi:hypothetical protein